MDQRNTKERDGQTQKKEEAGVTKLQEEKQLVADRQEVPEKTSGRGKTQEARESLGKQGQDRQTESEREKA